MPQISAVISKSILDAIEKKAKEDGISRSKVCTVLLERGLAYSHEQEKFLYLKKNQLELKKDHVEQRRALSRMVNIVSELFLKLNDGEPFYDLDKYTAEEILHTIRTKAEKKFK